MTTRESIIAHVESIIAGDPTPQALNWLADGFRDHIDGQGTLTAALDIDEQCPQGLPLAVARSRWRQKIAEAIAHLPEESSAYSMARVVKNELTKYRARRPTDSFGAALYDAKTLHPTGTTSVSGLRDAIAAIREAA